jgi:hypothetical protein
VKKILLLSIVMLSMFSCDINNDSILITEESDEERPMFTVEQPNGTRHEHMFAEEIAQGLLDGKWERNEDLTLSQLSEYQLYLEDDSLIIYSFNRKIAAVPYHQTGVLDSIFIADNQ